MLVMVPFLLLVLLVLLLPPLLPKPLERQRRSLRFFGGLRLSLPA